MEIEHSFKAELRVLKQTTWTSAQLHTENIIGNYIPVLWPISDLVLIVAGVLLHLQPSAGNLYVDRTNLGLSSFKVYLNS